MPAPSRSLAHETTGESNDSPTKPTVRPRTVGAGQWDQRGYRPGGERCRDEAAEPGVVGRVGVEHVLGHVRAHGVHPWVGGVDDPPDLVYVFADRRIGQHLLGHRVVSDQPPSQTCWQPHMVNGTLRP